MFIKCSRHSRKALSAVVTLLVLFGGSGAALAQSRQLAVPAESAGVVDQRVVIPVTIDNGEGVHSVAIELSWSPQVLKFAGLATKGDRMPAAWTLDWNELAPGRLRIAGLDLAGGSSLLQGPGTVVLVAFDVVGGQGATTSIEFGDCGRSLSNAAGQSLPATCTPGSFRVANVPRRVLTVTSLSPACPEEFVRVPVQIDDAGGITKVDTVLTFDPTRLRLDAVDRMTTTKEMSIDWHQEPTGIVTVRMTGTSPLPSGPTALFELLFFVRSRAPADRGRVFELNIEFESCRGVLNEGAIPSVCTPGVLSVPGYCFGQGWNLLGPAVDLPPGTDGYTSKDLCADIDLDGTARVSKVAEQDGTAFVEYSCGAATGDFPISVGPAYFVLLTAPGTWTPSGTEVPSFGTFLRADVPANLVSLPDWAPRFTAEEICQQIVAEGLSSPSNAPARRVALEVSQWTPVDWKIHPCGTPSHNFTIEPGEGFAVKVSEDTTWTFPKPAAPTPAAEASRSGTFPVGELEVARLARERVSPTTETLASRLDQDVQVCPAVVCGSTDRGAILHWQTFTPTTGYVAFGTSPQDLKKKQCDQRDSQSDPNCNAQSSAHFVEVPLFGGRTIRIFAQVVSGNAPLGAPCILSPASEPLAPVFPKLLSGGLKAVAGSPVKTGVVTYRVLNPDQTTVALERCSVVEESFWAVDRRGTPEDDPGQEYTADAGLETGCASGDTKELVVDPAKCDCPDVDLDGYHPPEAEPTACRRVPNNKGFTDCNDFSLEASPEGTEALATKPGSCTDGVDNDCDGNKDLADAGCACPDVDGDGFVACTQPLTCAPSTGRTCGDCDDRDAERRPGLAETCDDKDNDCDGTTDEDVVGAPSWIQDADGDGFGNPGTTIVNCRQPTGYVASDKVDCDDTNPNRNPGETEAFDAPGTCNDGVDNDCDGTTDLGECECQGPRCADVDQDGYPNCTAPCVPCGIPCDCNDGSSDVLPGGQERCNRVDDDCDATVDEEAIDAAVWYRDEDGDGYGKSGFTTRACDKPAGYVAVGTPDCDDALAAVNPGVREARDQGNCENTLDDDCDGTIDVDRECSLPPCEDRDADTVYACDDACDSSKITDRCGDCDDADAGIPGVEGLTLLPRCADGKDNDCDEAVDLLDSGCRLGISLSACVGKLSDLYNGSGTWKRLAFSTDPSVARTRRGDVTVTAKNLSTIGPGTELWAQVFNLVPGGQNELVHFSIEVCEQDKKKNCIGYWQAMGAKSVVVSASAPATGLSVAVKMGTPTFTWTGPGCSNGKYRVEFSNRGDFVAQFSKEVATKNYKPATKKKNNERSKIEALRLSGSPLYWRVIAYDRAGRGIASAVATY